MFRVTKEVMNRFMSKVSKLDNGCWEWRGARTNSGKGYGSITVSGRIWATHRFSYKIHKGKIPKGLCICHSCDNPVCINPEHLWLGSKKENSNDASNKGRMPHGQNHYKAKLKEKDIKTIFERRASGKKLREIAEEFNTDISNISVILKGKRWKHLTS